MRRQNELSTTRKEGVFLKNEYTKAHRRRQNHSGCLRHPLSGIKKRQMLCAVPMIRRLFHHQRANTPSHHPYIPRGNTYEGTVPYRYARHVNPPPPPPSQTRVGVATPQGRRLPLNSWYYIFNTKRILEVENPAYRSIPASKECEVKGL